MADFNIAWPVLMDLEGWGTDHTVVGDPGGRTIWGISENNHPHMFRHGPPSEAQAKVFYLDRYWGPLRLGEIHNQVVANEIFEFAVHATTPVRGRSNVAVRTAQEAYNDIADVSSAPKLAEDGLMGPKTLGALNCLGDQSLGTLAWDGRFNLRQLRYYRGLRRSLVDQFLLGWTRRVIA